MLPLWRLAIFSVTLDALKHRNVPEINRVLEWFVRLMAGPAFAVRQRAQIDGVNKRSGFYGRFGVGRIVDHRVADVAVSGDRFAVVADVIAVVAAEASVEIKVSDIVRVRLPVGLHFGEDVSLKDPLNLANRTLD